MKRQPKDHYAVCIKCGRIEPFWMMAEMVADCACPTCHEPRQFGPTVYSKGFRGYTMKEAMQQRASKAWGRQAAIASSGGRKG